jgi:hypothetical protein
MRLLAALSGELDKIMADELKAAERAVTTGVRQATEGLKADLRMQITAAGMGQRLARFVDRFLAVQDHAVHVRLQAQPVCTPQ